MKLLLLIATAFFSLCTNAQNVGIGTPTPAEKLDVNGNVNITGALKTNGDPGSNGQVLMSTGTGLSWGSMMNYKKSVSFMTGSGSWTVPAGVTEIMVELWGGGSGGTALCGGTSGGYARTVQTVTPGLSIPYTIGGTGNAGSIPTPAGNPSTVTFPAGVMQALGGGGQGANTFQPGPVYSGSGLAGSNVFFMYGNSGGFTYSTYGQRTATVYTQTFHFGSGGAPVGMFNSTPVEGDIVTYENAVFTTYAYSLDSKLPSAGGAGGVGSGWFGAGGMVIFWYN